MNDDPEPSGDQSDVKERVCAASREGLAWDRRNDNARKPLYNLASVMDAGALGTAALACAVDGTVAVTIISQEYARVGLNWIEAMRRIGWTNYLVVAGDHATFRILKNHSVPCVEARLEEALSDANYLSPVGFTQKGIALTALKFPVVHALLELGLNVILSDADAVWLQNPLDAIGAWWIDCAFQRIVYFPRAVATVWGFAACTGFMFFRSGAGTIALTKACIDEHRLAQDDQVAAMP